MFNTCANLLYYVTFIIVFAWILYGSTWKTCNTLPIITIATFSDNIDWLAMGKTDWSPEAAEVYVKMGLIEDVTSDI